MILGEVNSGLSIIDRIINGLKKRKAKTITSVAEKFVALFEAHGVKRNQIPRFFDHAITLSDLVDDDKLLIKLTEPILEAACSLFAVRREWLDGENEEPYVRHDFYKYPGCFKQFIDELTNEQKAEVGGYLIVPEDITQDDPSLLILEEAIGTIGDKVIYRYHFCDDWVYSYWKSRAYLTACIAIAWKKDVYVKGRYASRDEIADLASKQVLPGLILARLALRGRRWFAEDLALSPDQYLKGVAPEENGFGLASGLSLWLQLDNDGWMDTGLGINARPAFEAEFNKYQDNENR